MRAWRGFPVGAPKGGGRPSASLYSMRCVGPCKLDKPLTDFRKDNTYPLGRANTCKKCHSTRSMKSLTDQKRKRRAAKKLEFNHGITQEQYDALLKSQGGVCAICKRQPGKTKLCVDHDHKTNRIRGLLCGKCNTALGLLNDDIAQLQAAIKYLILALDSTPARSLSGIA